MAELYNISQVYGIPHFKFQIKPMSMLAIMDKKMALFVRLGWVV